MALDITGQLRPSPSCGYFFTIRSGDTLLAIAGQAFGVPAGASRLEAARVINDAKYNDRFRGKPTDLFPNGLVSFSPRFVESPNVQAEAAGPAPAGPAYASLWIPTERGHEPELAPEPEDDESVDPIDPQPEPEDDETPKPLPPPHGKVIDWEQLHRGIAVASEKPTTVYLRPELIPIIIIPGIAGSALEPKDPDDRLVNGPGWPVNNVGQMLKLLVRGARRKRRNILGPGHHDPSYLQVIGQNDPRAASGIPGLNKKEWFGRGNATGLLGVAASKYRAFVNRILDRDAKRREDRTRAGVPVRSRYFRTPPFCFGYNWTSDIRLSGAALLKFVDDYTAYHRSLGSRCNRVILVTHSTGGLVARSALQQDPSFAERVVAVYHNGVPHVGAPEAYFRVKSGFPQDTLPDKLVSWATMRNGNESAAIFGNIVGGLGLLPSSDYRTNDGDTGWLELQCESDGQTQTRSLPEVDCYTEIYTLDLPTRGLIDKRLLDPRMRAKPDEEFELFKERIDQVKSFHTSITGIEFATAIQVYSTGSPTPDKIVLECTTDMVEIEAFVKKHPLRKRINQGDFIAVGAMESDDPREWLFDLAPRDGDGDATVPTKVADGTHLGAGHKLEVPGLAHADMLADIACQWQILESIERQLDRLIYEFEVSLRDELEAS